MEDGDVMFPRQSLGRHPGVHVATADDLAPVVFEDTYIHNGSLFGDSVGLSPAPGVGDRAAIRSDRQETSGYRLTVPGTHHPGGRSMLNHRSDPIQPECLAGPRMTTKFNAQAPRPPRTGVRWHRPPPRLGRPVEIHSPPGHSDREPSEPASTNSRPMKERRGTGATSARSSGRPLPA